MNTKSNNKDKLLKEQAEKKLAELELSLKAEAEEYINSRPTVKVCTPDNLPRDEYLLRTPHSNPYGKIFNRTLTHSLFQKGN